MEALLRAKLNDLIYDLNELPDPPTIQELKSIHHEITILLSTINTSKIDSKEGRHLKRAIADFNRYSDLINLKHNPSFLLRKMVEEMLYIHDSILLNFK
jgi:hypothetical protein